MMKRRFLLSAIMLFFSCALSAQEEENQEEPTKGFTTNIQLHSNVSTLMYGKGSSLASSLPLFTTTFEGNGWDNLGSTYYFIDLEFGNVNNKGDNRLAGNYFELCREWCFWSKSKAKDLTIHTEVDAGVGYGGDSFGTTQMGWDFTSAFLLGLSYSWFGDDYFTQIQALSRYELKDRYGSGGEGWQLTFVWSYTPVDWFEFSGYMDLNQNPLGKGLNDAKTVHLALEPYIWFKINSSWAFGSRVRFTYNCYQGTEGFDQKVYCAPTVAARWTIF